MNFFSTLFVISLAAAAIALPASPVDKSRGIRGSKPVYKTTGKKIVVLKQGVNHKAFDTQLKQTINAETSAGRTGNTIDHQYTLRQLKGYSGKFTDKVVKMLEQHPMVASVEEDSIGWVERQEQPSPPSWGQSRISNRALDLTKPYVYDETAGAGVNAYVLDTGIDVTHEEFKSTQEGGPSRATFGMNFIKDEAAEDLDGHGTHVGGTIAGTTFGLAKRANLIAVKVCDQFGSCSTSNVVAGLQWIIKTEQTAGRKNKAVVNISLGLAPSQALDDTVQAAVDAGIAVIVSGGNANTDSCLNSPRRAPASFAVGASDNQDQHASFSNWGTCLKIFAPGVDIISAQPGGGSQPMSGTSMASPHVAGVAALYLAQKDYESIPQLHDDLRARATKDIVKNLRNADKTINLMAYSLLTGAEQETPAPSTLL